MSLPRGLVESHLGKNCGAVALHYFCSCFSQRPGNSLLCFEPGSSHCLSSHAYCGASFPAAFFARLRSNGCSSQSRCLRSDSLLHLQQEGLGCFPSPHVSHANESSQLSFMAAVLMLRWDYSFAVFRSRVQRLEAKLHCFDELDQVGVSFAPTVCV